MRTGQTVHRAGTGSRPTTDFNTRSARATLRAEVARLAAQSVAPKTMQAYQQAMHAFDAFRQAMSYTGVKIATPAQVSEFIAWLSLQRKAHATVSCYVAGLSFWHRIHCLPDPTNCFLIKKLLSALRRRRQVADKRLPISPIILKQLIHGLASVTKSRYELTLYQTVFIIAYFGFLRLGEIAAESKQRIAGGLLATDVRVQRTGGQDMVVITLRHTKTSQYGFPQIIKLQSAPGNTLCPVLAVQRFMAVRPQAGVSFFCHFDGSCVTRHQLQATLRKVTAAIGLNSHRYTSHSFRIGVTTSAAAAGFSPEQIQSCGRWRSAAFRTYIRQPDTVPSHLLAWTPSGV